jgi:hypothetical protein
MPGVNLGELTKYPFVADVWGDVATWFGSIGTTFAAVAAAGYYINDKRTQKREQASHVSMHYADIDGRSYRVRNNSDNRIYGTEVTYDRPATVREALKSSYYPFNTLRTWRPLASR